MSNRLFLIPLFLMTSHILGAEELIKTDPIQRQGYILRIESTELARLEAIRSKENLAILDRIVLNLRLFEEEIEKNHLLKNAHFILKDTEQQGPVSFNQFEIMGRQFSNNEKVKIEKKYHLEKIELEGSHIKFLSIQLQHPAHVFYSYDIYNLSFSEEGDILERIIIKSIRDNSLSDESSFFKFVEGLEASYSSERIGRQPSTILYKTFLFDQQGKKIVMKEKESHHRKFHENGMIKEESTREATYSYRDLAVGKKYAIYNVVLHTTGLLSSYDVLFKEMRDDTTFVSQENVRINIKRNEQGEVLEELIRFYVLRDDKIIYMRGRVQITTMNELDQIQNRKEVHFNIREGTEGLASNERVSDKVIYLWNLEFDRLGNILFRRILKTFFEKGNGENEYFHSFREIKLMRDGGNGRIKKVLVEYKNMNQLLNWVIDRRIDIDVVEYLVNGDPVKIELTIESPDEGQEAVKMSIVQDCQYILNEAVGGELFFLKTNKDFDIEIKEISSKGAIKSIVAHYYNMKSGEKVYFRQQLKEI